MLVCVVKPQQKGETMKTLILTAILASIATSSFAYDVYVHGYTRQDGTYVDSYHRSSPDGYKWNNYNQ